MGGRVFDREGDAGRVAGLFQCDVHFPGYISDRPCAAFLRPQDRDLFHAAVQLREALRDRRKDDAKYWFKKIRPSSEGPSPLVWERERDGTMPVPKKKLRQRRRPAE